MFPILFRFESPPQSMWLFHGTVVVPAYGVMLALGSLLASVSLWRNRKSIGLPGHHAIDLICLTALAIFVGGKLFYFLERPSVYLRDPALTLKAIGFGFVFYGSFLTALGSICVYSVLRSISPLNVLDLVARSAPLIHGFGKIGCLLAGCCYGKESGGHYGLIFNDAASAARPLHVPLVPVQLYDILVIVAIALYLGWLARRPHYPGELILSYALIYSAGRFCTEFLRGDVSRGLCGGGVISYAQIVAMVVGPLSLWLIMRQYRKKPQ